MFAELGFCLPKNLGIVGPVEPQWGRLAEAVSQRRQGRGWSQRAVTERGGPSDTQQTKIESGQWRPTRGVDATLKKIDAGLLWRPGSASEVLAGGDPTALDESLSEYRENLPDERIREAPVPAKPVGVAPLVLPRWPRDLPDSAAAYDIDFGQALARNREASGMSVTEAASKSKNITAARWQRIENAQDDNIDPGVVIDAALAIDWSTYEALTLAGFSGYGQDGTGISDGASPATATATDQNPGLLPGYAEVAESARAVMHSIIKMVEESAHLPFLTSTDKARIRLLLDEAHAADRYLGGFLHNPEILATYGRETTAILEKLRDIIVRDRWQEATATPIDVYRAGPSTPGLASIEAGARRLLDRMADIDPVLDARAEFDRQRHAIASTLDTPIGQRHWIATIVQFMRHEASKAKEFEKDPQFVRDLHDLITQAEAAANEPLHLRVAARTAPPGYVPGKSEQGDADEEGPQLDPGETD